MPRMMEGLRDAADRFLTALPPGPLVVGYSGGLDSSVLLHWLATSPAARARGLAALHVDHGLHPASAEWAAHGIAFAAQLGIVCHVRRVNVARDAGLGLEAAARAARHAAFAAALPAGGALALAHHRDDQNETVLLKLLRGAGPEGLAAMRDLRPFASGWLWRPLLTVPRAEIRAYAERHRLEWIEDPGNADHDLARNFLRGEILPRLRRHWPRLDEALGHAAGHARAAADFIARQAEIALGTVRGEDRSTLRWRAWLDLPDALRDPVLRLWLRALGHAEPTRSQVTELERQLHTTAAERLPCVTWADIALCRYREHLHAVVRRDPPPVDWQMDWDGRPLVLPAGCGRLRLEPVDAAPAAIARTAAPPVQVRFRRGGEWLRLPGRLHRSELRDLFQQTGIPPWERGRLPLVCRETTVLTVGDRWISTEGRIWLAERQARLVWERT